MPEVIDKSLEIEILDSFVEIVKLPYGDFNGIGKLAYALNDKETLDRIISFLSLTPHCKKALVDLQLLGKIDFNELYGLSNITLGYAYADHMIRNNFDPPPVNDKVKSSYEFFGTHLGETHDIWHVVTGCDTDKPGEVKLEAFYAAQLVPDRLFLALLAKNLLKTAIYENDLCDEIVEALIQGWEMGKQAQPLFGIQWDKLWETPLEEVRESLCVRNN